MSISTDGQICFGFLFEEDYEFPWDTEEFVHDIDTWWLEGVNQYKPPFQMYNDRGEYIDGVEPSKERFDIYYSHKDVFKATMPKVPVELVNCQSCDYPVYILAVPGTVRSASRGSPEMFEPDLLKYEPGSFNALVEFLEKYNIVPTGDAEWYLSSLWC